MRGKPLQQPGQLQERIRGRQLVQIIDDEERTLALLRELGQDPLADSCLVEVRRRRPLLPVTRCAGCLSEGGKHGKPELLGVLLVALHLDDCHPVAPAGAVCPRPQQRGLPAAGRGRDQRYLCSRRAIEGSNEFRALNQSRSCRTWPCRICARCHTRIRSGPRGPARRSFASSQATRPGYGQRNTARGPVVSVARLRGLAAHGSITRYESAAGGAG